MAFLDNIFGASNYSDTLSRLLGYPQYQQMGASEGFPDSYGKQGDITYPIFGKPDTTELSAQAVQPQAQYAPQPQPPQRGGLGEGLRGFITNAHTGPIGAILGGIAGLSGMEINNPVKPTDDIREYEYAKRQGFKGTFPDWLQRKRGTELSNTPVYGQDSEGNTVLLQVGRAGEAVQTKLPPGVKVSSGIEKIDLGTEWGLYDKRTGIVVGRQPKKLQEAAEQKAFGTKQGEAGGEFESIASKMPGLKTVVSQLNDLSEKATYTLAGQGVDIARRQLNLDPREAAVARKEYEAVVNNQILPLLRDTFGAQFTEREGQTLRATLGDPNISPKEKQAVIKAFIEQKGRDVEALQRRTGRTTEAAPQASPKSVDPILEAKQAIARGAPRERVIERLKSMGINPSGL